MITADAGDDDVDNNRKRGSEMGQRLCLMMNLYLNTKLCRKQGRYDLIQPPVLVIQLLNEIWISRSRLSPSSVQHLMLRGQSAIMAAIELPQSVFDVPR